MLKRHQNNHPSSRHHKDKHRWTPDHQCTTVVDGISASQGRFLHDWRRPVIIRSVWLAEIVRHVVGRPPRPTGQDRSFHACARPPRHRRA